jgi:hypothetical protein
MNTVNLLSVSRLTEEEFFVQFDTDTDADSEDEDEYGSEYFAYVLSDPWGTIVSYATTMGGPTTVAGLVDYFYELAYSSTDKREIVRMTAEQFAEKMAWEMFSSPFFSFLLGDGSRFVGLFTPLIVSRIDNRFADDCFEWKVWLHQAEQNDFRLHVRQMRRASCKVSWRVVV